MKYIFLLTFVLFPILLTAQGVVFEKEIKLKRTLNENREAYPVVNEVDKIVSLFLIDRVSIQGLLFDRNFNLLNTIVADKPEDQFTELLGSNLSHGNYNLFFSTKSNNAFACVSFNFQTQTFHQNLINLAIKKELYIGSISYENKFYFITVPKNSSIIKLYIFDNNFHYVVKIFDFPNHHFTSDELSYKLSHALHNETVEIIDNEIPNAINITSSPVKLYCYSDSIVLTTNISNLKTTLIAINTNTLESSIQVYPFPSNHCDVLDISANSYIHANKLYQFIPCGSEMGLSIINLNTNQVIKEYSVKEDEEIFFKNSPIMRETNGLYGEGERTLTKTKQFLRKVFGAKPGISVSKVGSNLELTLGGYLKVEHGSPGGMMPSVAVIATPAGLVSFVRYNPTFYGFSNFSSTACTYFKSLLDTATYEHKIGAIQKNAFDKINELKDKLNGNITAITVFRQNGFLLFAYYIKETDKYVIQRFR